MMVGQFLVLTGACQFDHGVGGFTTNFIHSCAGQTLCARWAVGVYFTNPNPMVRKSGAVAEAVRASIVLEEGLIRAAEGIQETSEESRKRALRGMPALLCTLRFCHAP